MRLAIFGLSISSSWGNGHATLWRGLCSALARQGHQVTFFERDVPYYRQHRDLHALPGGRLVFYPNWHAVEREARAAVAAADAAIVTSYCPDALAAARLVHAHAHCSVFYDLDTGVTLTRLAQGEPVPYIGSRGLGDYDVVLSYTGGRALELLREQLGARVVHPLYGSVDPGVHYRVDAVPELACDLSYIATYAPDRHQPVLDLLVQPARQLPRRRFLIAGPQYPLDFPWRDNIHYIEHVPPARHGAFYSSSRATLNLTRAAMASFGYCPSGRLFEAAAAAVPILSDAWEGLDDFFTPGLELLVVRSAADVRAALELDPAQLERIGLAARQRTLAEHTADRRALELQAALSGAAPSSARPHVTSSY